MKQIQKRLLQSIQQNYNNQQFLNVRNSNNTINIHQNSNQQDIKLYVSQKNTKQQLFLEKLINIYVLRKKQFNKLDIKRIQKLINQNKGAFTYKLLTYKYMAYCMENKLQVSYEKFGILKILTVWMEIYQKIQSTDKLNLMNKVFTCILPQNHTLSNIQEMIIYLNYIAHDVHAILNRNNNKKQIKNQLGESSINIQQKTQNQNRSKEYEHLDANDLLNFLNAILPRTIYSIVIPQGLLTQNALTNINLNQQRQRDFLYADQNHQYFAKQKKHFQDLAKQIISILLKIEINQSQQKLLMQILFKYFYLFNRIKTTEPFSLFIKVYQKITDAVKFALSDQFLLFFKIIKKLGYTKFISFLRQKYQWIQTLLKKIDPLAIIGNIKDFLNPFNFLGIRQHISVYQGTIQKRYFQIYEPYSIIYFYIGIKNLDINIRLYYLGTFSSSIEVKKTLINKQRAQIQFRGNIIAIQKGIYMFEFDNSYSWIKGKNIHFQNIILTPIQLTDKRQQKQKFINVLYNREPMNYCPQSSLIDIQNLSINSLNQLQGQKQKITIINSNKNINAQNLQKNYTQQEKTQNNTKQKEIIKIQYSDSIYKLQKISQRCTYQHQTQNQKLFIDKVKQIYEKQKQKNVQCQWLVQRNKIQTFEQIQKWIINTGLKQKQQQQNFSNQQNKQKQVHQYISQQNQKQIEQANKNRISKQNIQMQKQQQKQQQTQIQIFNQTQKKTYQ